jgi:biotin synthase-like enzyme
MGDKLLTTPNPESNDDAALMKKLGLHPLDPQKAREIHELAEASL